MNGFSTELSDLSLMAEGMKSIAAAIHAAMESGPDAESTYTPAVWMLERLLHEHHKAIEQMENQA